MVAFKAPGATFRSRSVSLPAPIGGWNARDALAEMPPTDAARLENWWPTTTDVRKRLGYSKHATGMTSQQVETLMPYAGGSTDKLFAVTSTGSIYEVTSSGAVSSAVVTGLTNGRWQFTQFANSGGTYLLAFNGADNGLRYDGTTWVAVPISTGKAITSGSGTGAVCTLNVTAHGLLTGNTITVTGCADAGYNQASVTITRVNANSFTYAGTGTGSTAGGSYTVAEGISVDPTKIANVVAFKNRIWLTEGASLKAYYLATDAISGTASSFPLQGVAQLGGYIQQPIDWSWDGGSGLDDLLVFATNKGEIIVYQGTDPTAVATFALKGVWQVGGCIGRRCMVKFGSDVALICQDGLIQLSSALKTARTNPSIYLTNKIQFAASTAIGTYAANFGWQLCYFPKQNMLVLNVPISTGSQQQFVMNTITGAWANFNGWLANCWCVWKDDLYFGGPAYVGKAWDTYADAGTDILGDAKQAYSYFGNMSQLKRFTMMRPLISTNGYPGVLCGIDLDFDDTATFGPLVTARVTTGIWDTSLWDSSLWAGSNSIQKQWQGVSGVGYAGAPHLRATSQGIDVRWMATDVVFEPGAIL